MRDVDTKINGNSYPADNFNAQRSELENAVLSADITLDPDAGPDTDLNMLGETMAAYGGAANVYQDSGAADAYVLAIASNLKTVTKYYDNMMIVFKAGNTNTGASTVNVNTLGVKSITRPDGTALGSGVIVAGQYVESVYSLSNDRFELTSIVDDRIQEIAIFREQQAQGVEGGGASAATWHTRTLNATVINNITGLSAASNRITMPAGTYEIEASAPAKRVDSHQAALYNFSDSTYDYPGTSEESPSGTDVVTRSLVQGTLVLASTKVFELRHYTETAKATDGLGKAVNEAAVGTEIYSTIKIRRIV